MVLSAQTTSGQVVETIFNQVEKRKRGVYGPAGGKKLVCVVDDLNMPKKETYGAQPPIELLRQYCDHSAWFIFKLNKEYIRIDDLVLFCAMGPPGGGRNFITARLKRHFNILTYTELEEEVIKSIFSKMVNSYLKAFNQNVKDIIDPLLDTTLQIYNNIKIDLLPIPSKSHYLFNLRDISKVFMGTCSGNSKQINEGIMISRLWYHEMLRVFHDRLTTDEDRVYIKDKLHKSFEGLG